MRCTNFGSVKTLFLIVNIFCAKAKLLVCDKTEEKTSCLMQESTSTKCISQMSTKFNALQLKILQDGA